MDNFQINDANALLDQAGNLYQSSQNILRVQESLTGCCQRISSAWQSDTVDKESYLKVLQENLQKMETLAAAITSLGSNLTEFAQNAIATANNGQ